MRACQPKDLKGREWRSALAPPFICFPPPGPALCKLGLARSAVCPTWSLHSGPRTFFCSIFVGFSLPCLLATAILDSFSLFYLPNNNILLSLHRPPAPASLFFGAFSDFQHQRKSQWQGDSGINQISNLGRNPCFTQTWMWYLTLLNFSFLI